MLPDLRTPSPDRTEVNQDTVTLLDWVEALKKVGGRLHEFEQTAESPKINAICSACDDAIVVIEDFKRRLRGISQQLNKEKRKAISEWSRAYFVAKHAQNKDLANKLKGPDGWIDKRAWDMIKRGELPRPD